MKYVRIDTHNHTFNSNFRLLDALPSPEALIDRAIEIGLAGVAITDHECLSGHIKANQKALKIKESNPDFKVILGDEIYLTNTRPVQSKEHYHFIFLAKDKIGHKQLRILSSLAWLNAYKAGMERVDTVKADVEKLISQDPGHLIATTACIGGELGSRILEVNKAIAIGDEKKKEENLTEIHNFLAWCKKLFKDDFYLEVQPGVSSEQIQVNNAIRDLSRSTGIKVIAASDSHYLKKEDRYVHKTFLNSSEGEREVDAFYKDAYLHTSEEMIEKFKKSNFEEEFVIEMFKNSMEIYDKIEDYSLQHSQQIPQVEVKDYPKRFVTSQYPVLESMFSSDDKVERYWINECYNKLKELNKDNDEYLSRLEEEARVKRIIGEKLETNIFAYPITLKHYIDRFWDLGSPIGAGRGSSCSGLNHYLLGVTQLDPIKWNLPFWRYLNEERIELPDIDLDLAPSKKAIAIEDIKKERGANFYDGIAKIFRDNLGCTLVAAFGTETTKSAIQTACRGYRSKDFPNGIDVDTAQYLSSLIPVERGFLWDLNTVVHGDAEKGRLPVKKFVAEVEAYPGLLESMIGIEGIYSRRSSHASGVVLFDEDPFEFSCFMRTPSGEVITQYDLHDAEWCG